MLKTVSILFSFLCSYASASVSSYGQCLTSGNNTALSDAPAIYNTRSKCAVRCQKAGGGACTGFQFDEGKCKTGKVDCNYGGGSETTIIYRDEAGVYLGYNSALPSSS